MALNFNQSPYHDDFDPNKNFHRILFKPGVAVQARELTQSQTILQNQISAFAGNIFKQNTPISGGNVTTNFNVHYIKLNPKHNGTTIVASNFLNRVVVDSTKTIKARVLATSEATYNGTTIIDYPTLVVSFLSGKEFTDNIIINSSDLTNYSATTIGVSGQSTSVGKSSVVSIDSGIFYVVLGFNKSSIAGQDGTFSKYSIGNFVNVLQQTIILSKYSDTPTCRVGLQITESIVDYVDDSSLLDPALGASNFQAPGADRYSITLTLVSKPLTTGTDDTFIELVRIENGKPVKMIDGTSYNVIDDYLAKRTYDTNGDYVVTDFSLTPSKNASNTEQFNVSVGRGVAYVRGYRVENKTPITLTLDRARTTNSIKDVAISTTYDSYLYVTRLVGSSSGIFKTTQLSSIDFHCVPTSNIVSTNISTYSSTLIGSAKIKNLVYVSNNDTAANANSYVYKAHISDISTNSLSSNVSSYMNTTSITIYDTTSKFSSANGAYVGVSITLDNGDVRTISSYDVSGSIKTVNVSSVFSSTLTSSSKFTLNFDPTDIVTMVGANSTFAVLSSAVVDVQSRKNGITKIESPSKPEMIFPLGGYYTKSISNINATTYESSIYFSGVSFASGSCQLDLTQAGGVNLSFKGSPTLTASELLANYIITVKTSSDTSLIGKILSWTTSGRSATISNVNHRITFTATDLSSLTSTTFDIIAKVNVEVDPNNSLTNRIERTKSLISPSSNIACSSATPSIVNIDSNTYVHLTYSQVYIKHSGIVSSGKQSLYVADIQGIYKIIDTGSPGTAPILADLTDSTKDVTSHYQYNDGQTDSYYDHGSIVLKSGSPHPKGDLLILFYYYNHTGGDGYLSVNSYPTDSYAKIPYYTATNGKTYLLRDCIDFRPVRLNADPSFTFRYNDTGSTKSIYFPENLAQFRTDYNYYLSRKDLIVISKDKAFNLITGAPAINSKFPPAPSGSLVIGKITIDPYTAFVQGETPTGILPSVNVEIIQHKRWTMQDISDLQSRVNNLEYYTALTALEQAASSQSVKDVNGLNRFKNGILVDDFSSFNTAATGSNLWSASINKLKKIMTASQSVYNFQLHNMAVLNSGGTLDKIHGFGVAETEQEDIYQHTNVMSHLYTLPYTSNSAILQKYATNTISLNPFATTITQGTLQLSPPMDNWVDNKQEPDRLLVIPGLQSWTESDSINVMSSTDYKSVTGSSTATKTEVTSSTEYHPGPAHGGADQGYGRIGAVVTTVSTTTTSIGVSGATEILGAYSQQSNSSKNDNNYIKDVSILPYIRAQEILIKGNLHKHNMPVTVTFDGTDISDYISQLDQIVLTNVQPYVTDKEAFPAGCVIGIETITASNASIFFPIATVVSTSDVDTVNKTIRLHVVGNYHSSYYDGNTSHTIISSTLKPDATWSKTYIGRGTSTGYNPITVHVGNYSSKVTSVGSEKTYASATPVKYYHCAGHSSWSRFHRDFGIWGQADGKGSLPYGKVSFTVPKTGTYYYVYTHVTGNVRAATGQIKINTTDITSYSTSPTLNQHWGEVVTSTAISLNAGINTVEFNISSSANTEPHTFAMVIADSPFSVYHTNDGWYGWGTYPNVGYEKIGLHSAHKVIFATNNLSASVYPLDAGTALSLPGKSFGDGTSGGMYYIGATKVSLGGIASDVNNFYVGCKLTIKASLVTVDAFGENPNEKQVITSAIIQSYDGNSRTCTLASGVNVSTGKSALLNKDITSTYSIDGTYDNYTLAVQAGGLHKHSTDDKGQYIGIFNVPEGIFKTGERVLRIDNRTVPSDPTTASVFAEATFTAQGLSTTSQSLEIVASPDGASHSFSSTQQLSNQVIAKDITTLQYKSPWDPVAQSFLFDDKVYPNGVFLESIDLYFQSVPLKEDGKTIQPSDVTLHIVPTENGIPTGKTLDHSIVKVDANHINVSDSSTIHYNNPDSITKFKFVSPVYVRPGTLYAVIIKGSDPDFNVYIGSQNGVVLLSTAKPDYTGTQPSQAPSVNQIPGLGGVFESQNGITWTPDQSKSLMINIHICEFNVNKKPTIPFVIPYNLIHRKPIVSSIMDIIDPTNTSHASKRIPVGDVTYDALNVTTTDFMPENTDIKYKYSTTLDSDNSATGLQSINPGQYAHPTYDDIYLDDGLGSRVLLAKSNNSFILNATLSSTDKYVSPVISDDGLNLFAVKWKINNMGLSNNNVKVTKGGTGYSGVSLTVSNPDIGSDIALASANVANGIITGVSIDYAGSGYLTTPTLSISSTAVTTNAVIVMSGETSPSGGNAKCRYLTKKVTLAPESSSQDLRVYYTAYKPLGSEIYTYYKIRSSNDPSKFDDNPWVLMTTLGSNKNIYSKNRTDLHEYEAAPGINGLANNIISYVGADGITRDNFIEFAVKIVLASSDSTVVPILTDLRALALPRGTGM